MLHVVFISVVARTIGLTRQIHDVVLTDGGTNCVPLARRVQPQILLVASLECESVLDEQAERDECAVPVELVDVVKSDGEVTTTACVLKDTRQCT